jgi:competence ComEA-like helix-hairpin-helix protein
MSRDDARAALLLAVLAAFGVGARLVLAPGAGAPGDVHLAVGRPTDSTTHSEVAEQAARLARPLAPGERIDLDRANAAELARLPRIGPALSARIVADRAERGPFGSLEALDRVTGIGPKLLEAIRPHASFSGVNAPRRSLDTP